MPRQSTVHRSRVGIVDAVVHRANDRRAVGLFRESREQFAHAVTGERGLDRLELASHFDRSLGLHVPHIEVARPAIQKQEDASIRLRSQPAGC